MKQLSMLVFAITLLTFTTGFIGNESGGGGDVIRANFLSIGAEVVLYLKQDPTGAAIVALNGLDLKALEENLTIDKISVSDLPLTDRTSSLVDAVIQDNKLILDRTRWTLILSSKIEIRYLVFHEMLRLAGVDDDDYVISKIMMNAQARQEKIGATTRSAVIWCNDPKFVERHNPNVFEIRKGERGLPFANFKLLSPNVITYGNSGDTSSVIRLSANSIQLSKMNNQDPQSVFIVDFDPPNSSLIIRVIAGPGQGTNYSLNCKSSSATDVNPSQPVNMPAAMEYIFAGL